jgi:GNAT superfamily N-acetyltransferase
MLADLSQPAISVAVAENLHALNRRLCLSPVAECLEVGGLFRWRTPVDHAWYNGVLCAEPPGEGAAAAARSMIEYFKSNRVAAFTWWLAPGIRTEDWAPHLLSQGYGLNQRLPGMARDLAGLPAWEPPTPAVPPLEIRLVEDRETLRLWAETFVTGYEVPEAFALPFFRLYEGLHDPRGPMRSYIGFRDGRAVATSTLFLAAGVAGIYDVATLPPERGLGYGSAMTLVPLREARDLGYRIGILQSSPQGFRVYERLGFQTVCTMDHFFWREDRNPEPPAV